MTLKVKRNGQFVDAESPGWSRPADWLAMPATTPGDAVVRVLTAVFDPNTAVAIVAAGDFTVDWGDGTVEDFTSGTQAEHLYVYASLPSDSACSRGYRQAVYSVTPQEGQTLTSVDLGQFPSIGNQNRSSTYNLDILVEGPDLLSLPFNETSQFSYLLERFVAGDLPAMTSAADMFDYASALAQVVIGDMPALDSASDMFYACTSLKSAVVGSMPAVTDLQDMFYTCYALEKVVIGDLGPADTQAMFAYCYALTDLTLGDVSQLTSVEDMFDYCYALKQVTLGALSSAVFASFLFYQCFSLNKVEIAALIDMSNLVTQCYGLDSVVVGDASGVTDASSAFYYSPVSHLILNGLTVDLDVSTCWLGHDALVALFNSLGTTTGATVTVTGQPGAADLTSDDLAIATDKGWTVAQ